MYEHRSPNIAYDTIPDLLFLGEYRRRLPVSMARMIENAYDWEHLPYIHASTFRTIEGIADGPWGWRARVVLCDESGERLNAGAGVVGADDPGRVQDIELLVDRERNYWATTVLAGVGAGLQIHTQATSLAEREIEVAVRFYLPESAARQLALLGLLKRILPFAAYAYLARKAGLNRLRRESTPAESLFELLQDQYAVLYDEDLGLMSDRQQALDRRRSAGQVSETTPADQGASGPPATPIETGARVHIGSLATLESEMPRIVEFARQRYCLNRWQGKWIVYAADCPHMFGPLQGAQIDDEGIVTCPWHGYRFRVTNGESCDRSRVRDLPSAPRIEIVDGELYLAEAFD